MSNFINSSEYKEAFEAYQKKVYKDILNPINIIITKSNKNYDNVYLFYDQKKVQDIFNIFLKEYESDGDLNLHLGYDTPALVSYNFMGVSYKAIWLWYDGETCQIPIQFNKT